MGVSAIWCTVSPYTCWIFLLLLVLYKTVAQSRAINIQHCIGQFQWPLLSAIGIVLLDLWALCECIIYHCFTETSLPLKVKVVSLTTGFVSLGFLGLLTWHIYEYGENCYDRREQSAEDAEDERKAFGMTNWANIGRHVEIFVDEEHKVTKKAKIFGLTDSVMKCVESSRNVSNSNESNALIEQSTDEENNNMETKHFYKVHVPPFHRKMEREPKDVKFVFEGQNFYQMTSVKDEVPMGIILLPGIFILMAMRAQNFLMPVLPKSVFLATGEVNLRHATKTEEALIRYQGAMGFASFYEALVVFACGCLFVTHFSLGDSMKKIGTGIKYINDQVSQQNSRTSYINRDNNAQDFVSQFRKDREKFAVIAHDYKNSMTFAGLLGIWCYALSNVLTSICWTALEILMDSSKPLLLKAVKILFKSNFSTKIGWLNNCTTLLCVFNITVILRMQELKQKQALGKHASRKFFPMQVFLFITQFQPFILDHIARYYMGGMFNHIYCRFWNIILLTFWCAFFIVWNYLVWRSTPKYKKDAQKAAKLGKAGKSIPLLQK